MSIRKYAREILLASLMFSAMAGNGMTKNNFIDYEEEPPEPKKKPIPNGCKEYTFYGITVIAINEKSAIKKCKKKAGIR